MKLLRHETIKEGREITDIQSIISKQINISKSQPFTNELNANQIFLTNGKYF
jgi:hypothetical protein